MVKKCCYQKWLLIFKVEEVVYFLNSNIVIVKFSIVPQLDIYISASLGTSFTISGWNSDAVYK